MKPTVLLFHVSPRKVNAIHILARKLGLRIVAVPPERQGCRIGDLFAGTGEDCPPEVPFSEEVLVMDLPGKLLDLFLQGLRQQHAAVALKAAHTATNNGWRADKLYQELCREREAFRQGTTAQHEL